MSVVYLKMKLIKLDKKQNLKKDIYKHTFLEEMSLKRILLLSVNIVIQNKKISIWFLKHRFDSYNSEKEH